MRSRAVIRNYGNLLLACGRFDDVVEWYDAMTDSPAVLASGAHGIAITACYRFVWIPSLHFFHFALEHYIALET